MAYICDICGKGKQFGHNVSFSQRKTAKVWKPNLQRQTIELEGNRLQVKVCTQCWRTLKKFRQTPTTASETTEKAAPEITESKPKTAAKSKAAAKPAPRPKAAAK